MKKEKEERKKAVREAQKQSNNIHPREQYTNPYERQYEPPRQTSQMEQPPMPPPIPPPMPPPIQREQRPPVIPRSGEITKTMISKRIAANEVMIRLGKIREIAVVSIVMVFLAAALSRMGGEIWMFAVTAYVIYGAFRLYQANNDIRHMRNSYGV